MLLSIILVAVFYSNVYALSPAPHAISIELGDGLVFYMAHPGEGPERFPRSGLHRDGELVYPFDEWVFWGRFYFSNDAMTFFIVPPNVGFMRFYDQGILQFYFHVSELLRYGQTYLGEPCPFSGRQNWICSAVHNPLNNTLLITTVEGNSILFDLQTGNMLSHIRPISEEPDGLTWWVVGVVLLAAVLALGGIYLYKIVKRTRSQNKCDK